MLTQEFTLPALALSGAFVIAALGNHFAYRPTVLRKGQTGTELQTLLQPLFRGLLFGGYGAGILGVTGLVVLYSMGFGLPERPPANPSAIGIATAYIAALGALLLLLTYRVFRYRLRSIEDPNPELGETTERIVRVHGNFIEYAPLGAVMLVCAAMLDAPSSALHLGGGMFVLARYVHAWGFSQAPVHPGRPAGIQLTLISLAYLVILLAVLVLPKL